MLQTILLGFLQQSVVQTPDNSNPIELILKTSSLILFPKI